MHSNQLHRNRTRRARLVLVPLVAFAALGWLSACEPPPQAPPPPPRCFGTPATIVGTAGSETLVGTAAKDVIVGLGGDDRIVGFDGEDVLCGGAGRDRIEGGEGKDLIDPGVDTDVDSLDGGSGADGVKYTERSAGVTVDLRQGKAAEDSVNQVENVYGTPFADDITGDAYENFLLGQGGNDTLRGAGGNDRLEVGGQNPADRTTSRVARATTCCSEGAGWTP
jgi:Ca2+-binding RTX toxin-like protein